MTIGEELSKDEATRLANELKKHVAESDGLTPVWTWAESDEALQLVQKAGYSPEEFLDEVELGLNFNASDFSKRFYQSYARQISPDLCNKDNALRKSVSAAIGAGTTSLIGLMAEALLIPGGAVALVAPIAAILLVKGIDAFCDMDLE